MTKQPKQQQLGYHYGEKPRLTGGYVWGRWVDCCRLLGRPDPVASPEDTRAAAGLAKLGKARGHSSEVVANILYRFGMDKAKHIVAAGHPLRMLHSNINGYLCAEARVLCMEQDMDAAEFAARKAAGLLDIPEDEWSREDRIALKHNREQEVTA